MFGVLSAWWAASSLAKAIPIRVLVAIVVAIVLTLIVGLGYHRYTKLQSDLTQAQVELSQEKTLRQETQATLDDLRAKHDEQIARVEALETQRAAVEREAAELHDQIRNMTLEEDIKRDPDKAIADLAARSRALNGLLERRSEGR